MQLVCQKLGLRAISRGEGKGREEEERGGERRLTSADLINH